MSDAPHDDAPAGLRLRVGRVDLKNNLPASAGAQLGAGIGPEQDPAVRDRIDNGKDLRATALSHDPETADAAVTEEAKALVAVQLLETGVETAVGGHRFPPLFFPGSGSRRLPARARAGSPNPTGPGMVRSVGGSASRERPRDRLAPGPSRRQMVRSPGLPFSYPFNQTSAGHPSSLAPGRH